MEAYVWFNLAVATGLRSAVDDRDRLAQKLSPEQRVEAQLVAAGTFQAIFGAATPGLGAPGLTNRP
jgi:hypothetical protein